MDIQYIDATTITNVQAAREAIISIAVPVIIAVLSWVGNAFVKFINSKREQANETITNDRVKMYMNLAADTAEIIVRTLNSTLVDDLKASHEDGKLTEEEIKDIRQKAFDSLVDTLSEEALTVIHTVIDDVDAYLTALIESAVTKIKENKTK